MNKIAFLIIGHEILSGKTRDINLQTLALKLEEKGYEIGEARIVADEESEIVKAVNELRAKYHLVFTSGGIGPTHDDITTESVAKAFGLKVVINEEARIGLEKNYKERSLPFNEARLKMATTPEGASLIYSLQTKAPGFRVENVCVLAGIPSIFNEMVDAVLSTMPEMAKIYTLSIEGEAHEGGIAKELELVQKAYLGKVFIGSYPKMTESGKSSLQITFRSRDLDLANECKEKVKKFIPLS